VKITWDFYRRNAIEGLFLSSGVIGDPEVTTERQIDVLKKLRDSGFKGYIHVRMMPGVPRDMIREVSLYANKFGVNAETTCQSRYDEICPNFDYNNDILRRMEWTNNAVKLRRSEVRYGEGIVGANDTQFVVGATGEPDREIIATIDRFMVNYGLRRPFFMSFDPVPAGGPVVVMGPRPRTAAPCTTRARGRRDSSTMTTWGSCPCCVRLMRGCTTSTRRGKGDGSFLGTKARDRGTTIRVGGMSRSARLAFSARCPLLLVRVG
jgi:hypothetical protein